MKSLDLFTNFVQREADLNAGYVADTATSALAVADIDQVADLVVAAPVAAASLDPTTATETAAVVLSPALDADNVVVAAVASFAAVISSSAPPFPLTKPNERWGEALAESEKEAKKKKTAKKQDRPEPTRNLRSQSRSGTPASQSNSRS